MPAIKLYGDLRRVAGFKEQDFPGATIGECLTNLCSASPALKDKIFAGEALRPHVRVILNGQDAELQQGLETPVLPEDVLAVFPPIAGG